MKKKNERKKPLELSGLSSEISLQMSACGLDADDTVLSPFGVKIDPLISLCAPVKFYAVTVTSVYAFGSKDFGPFAVEVDPRDQRAVQRAASGVVAAVCTMGQKSKVVKNKKKGLKSST